MPQRHTLTSQSLKITFELGRPFRPLEQLMAVFPAASSASLPEKYRALMM